MSGARRSLVLVVLVLGCGDDHGSPPSPVEPVAADAGAIPEAGPTAAGVFLPGALPAGCEDLVQARQANAERPSCAPARVCRLLAEGDSHQLRFSVMLNKGIWTPEGRNDSLEQSEQLRLQGCVAGYLRNRGLTVDLDDAWARALEGAIVYGRYSEIYPVLSEVARVMDIYPGCPKNGCSYCYQVDPASCDAQAACGVFRAERIDADRNCREAPRPVACVPFDQLCDQDIYTARDSAQQCWLMRANCGAQPSDWRVDHSCGLAERMPACP